jgi:tetratricopeptide (TPR) repeat protein
MALKAGDWPKAIEDFEQALQVAPLHADVWFSVGAAYMRLEDERSAARAFVRSLGVNEDDWQTWANLSAVYSRRRETMSQAKTAAMEAVKRNKNNFKLWENLSIISMCLDDLQSAMMAERQLTLIMKREDRPDVAVMQRIFMEARSRRITEPGFFTRAVNLFKDIAEAPFIKADKQWKISLMFARLENVVDQNVHALDLNFRALRLATEVLDKDGVEQRWKPSMNSSNAANLSPLLHSS